ncbi:uncharacterized protein CC84DRAFT_1258774 [Paraphaeosphaeria sporulosa]|uniref:Tat pathway signal sequence n=1 Tax=Paraphaeosphaeria sporulosa TaxID=1460663 RepID=A0A177CJR8_9PLEO|nr:uncharacterized protein CC84DRAFT_1258774 [Paraphaeosphaeria sporulosa]OAG07743.1 hypothetical protein CC84DRAFT_1258774 [Paraphaeosphaeria sporulosa]
MGIWSPKKHYLNQVGFEQHQDQPKRISTSAGHRLTVILENGASDSHTSKTREAHRDSIRKSGLSAILADVPEDRGASAHSSGYSYNVWSENEKFAALRNHKQIAKRGGWKRLLTILAVILLLIIALGVGLGVGLKKKSESSSSSTPTTSSNSDSGSADTPASPTSTSTSSASSSAQPSNFPLGTYSLVTFLDTVQTNCTSNPLTWTCAPYTDYYTSVSKSQAIFNWIISGSKDAYKISSTDNPFSISFKNADLELLDEGKDNERFRFQIDQTKTVSPSTNLTSDNAAVECDFVGNLQGVMYTKMAKEYPSDQDPDASTTYTTWPYAVKVEQTAAGGNNVPSCYKTTSSGQHGESVSLEAEVETTMCSCLYKNWHTPM